MSRNYYCEKECRPKCKSENSCDVRVEFRRLWGEHAIYTQFYINSVLGEFGNANLLATRLLRNQDDIGNFLRPYIGNSSANQITILLKEHILAAAEAVAAVKAGNQTAINAAVAKLFANSTQFSTLVSGLNPCKLPFDEVKRLFDEHVQFVIDITVATNNGNFAEAIRLFDLYYPHLLAFSDLLFKGLIKPCLRH